MNNNGTPNGESLQECFGKSASRDDCIRISEEAMRLIKSGQTKKALKLMHSAIAEGQVDSYIYFLTAKLRKERDEPGDIEKAFEYLELSLEFEPDDNFSHQLMGDLYSDHRYEEKHLDKALTHYQKAWEIELAKHDQDRKKPKRARKKRNPKILAGRICQTYLALKQPEQALAVINASLSRWPEDARGLTLKCFCLFDLQKLDKIEKVIKRLERLEPHSPHVTELWRRLAKKNTSLHYPGNSLG